MPNDRGLEIGGTWYGPEFQRTVVNTECKYLLLQHAFETLGCIRVQLKTDLRNERSQKAIERIGAVKEGVLRNHMILPDGHYRHSVFYSILDTEWPGVKKRLGRDDEAISVRRAGLQPANFVFSNDWRAPSLGPTCDFRKRSSICTAAVLSVRRVYVHRFRGRVRPGPRLYA